MVYQIQANSPQRCQRYAQGIRAEIRSKNFDGAAVCTSVDDQDFRYQSSLLDEWDGSTFVISAKTEMMCEYLAGELAKAKAPSTDRQRITQTSPCKLR